MNNCNKNKHKYKLQVYKRTYVEHQRDSQRKQNKTNKSYKQRLVRGQLYHLVGKEVHISAVLTKHYLTTTMDTEKPVLFTDCVVYFEFYEHHFWIHIPIDVRHKLLLAPDKSRVYFKGTPYVYTSRNDHESDKIGITDINLTTELN